MSQSPEAAVRRARYEDGWEAINRMIREDGSWSGRERNCFHVGCDDGTFVDASAASGLDFVEDGRAFAVMDYDGDGDPDLLLRSRNGPRLRVLQNRLSVPNRSVWFHLRGVRSNRDAIGARVEIETDRGRRIREVKAGSGFLSQHSRWLAFGLGPAGEVRSARVRWPGGRVQDLTGIAPGRRYRVTEGEAPVAEPFAAQPEPAAPPGAPAGDPPQDSPLASIWLVDPLPAPGFRLPDLAGRAHALSDYGGKPLAVLFLTASCPICRAEVGGLSAGLGEIRAAGGALVAVALDGADHAAQIRDRFGGAAFPVLVADRETAIAWNTVHRSLFNRYRDLAVPTLFLLGSEGRIEKVYRGPAGPAEIAGDLRRLPLPAAERLRLALPFPGVLAGEFRRDLFLLGAGLVEAGLAVPAVETFRTTLEAGDDPEALYNLGLALSDSGDPAGAASAYRKALAARPDLLDARNNLGILEARAGRIAEARNLFSQVLRAEPGHGEAALNLARTHLDDGRPDVAEKLYREALAHDPESATLHSALGFALYRQGRADEGIDAYRRALALDPGHSDAGVGLTNLLIQRGGRADLPEAKRTIEKGLATHPKSAPLLNALGLLRAVYEDFSGAESAYLQAIGADPRSDGAYLNLARLRISRNDRSGAVQVLRRLLAAAPEHPGAMEMLKKLTADG